MPELSEAIHNQITSLCATGDDLAKQQEYADAIASYWSAWDLLPEPKTEWDAATWILVAIGEANFFNNDFEAGRDNLSSAMRCPGTIGNPFIHFRLGQCQFELENYDRAADELMRAYMGAGREIFDQHDPKYFHFLASKADGIE
ncbi:hypothetical protein BH09VER1_BH09VER1_40260 [soil metagenome]